MICPHTASAKQDAVRIWQVMADGDRSAAADIAAATPCPGCFAQSIVQLGIVLWLDGRSSAAGPDGNVSLPDPERCRLQAILDEVAKGPRS